MHAFHKPGAGPDLRGGG